MSNFHNSDEEEMTENLIIALNQLKNKLDDMELNYDTKLNLIENRTKTHLKLDNKLNQLKGLQSDRIKVKSNGIIYETTHRTISNCIFDNIFKINFNVESDYISNAVINNNIHKDDEDYYDYILNLQYFEIILKICRYFQVDSKNLNNKFPVFINDNTQLEIMKIEILYFFKENQKVLEMLEFKNI